MPKNSEFIVATKDHEEFFINRYKMKFPIKNTKKNDVLMVSAPTGDGNPLLFVIRKLDKKNKVVMMMIFN